MKSLNNRLDGEVWLARKLPAKGYFPHGVYCPYIHRALEIPIALSSL